jgi:anti-sigma regulatory factor (Ser/Thr protein kinase)
MEVRQASVVLLPCEPSSVGTARGRLRSELRACGIFPGTIGDAALVVSELLSNAILHARPLPGSRVRVSWALGPAWIELAVGDGGSETLPRAFHPSLSAIGGRGLAIVEHLCSSWGIRDDDLGITVWAVLPAAQLAGTIAGSHESTERFPGLLVSVWTSRLAAGGHDELAPNPRTGPAVSGPPGLSAGTRQLMPAR